MGDISKKGKSKILLNKSNRPTLGTFKEFPIEIARKTYNIINKPFKKKGKK